VSFHSQFVQFPIIHKLFYTWTGWPAEGCTFPPDPKDSFFNSLAAPWEHDGIHYRSYLWQAEQIQIACGVEPLVAPVLFTSRMKGRLQHALRQAGLGVAFSRKVGLRAIGENLTAAVEQYLREQLERGEFADPRYRASLAAAAIEDPAVDLAQPVESHSGRYWYNLHVVLTAQDRYRIGREDYLPRLRAATQSWVVGNGCALKALAVMPDHVHAAMRGNISLSPAGMAQGLWQALNRAAGCALYSDRLYVGTFSEYSLRALR